MNLAYVIAAVLLVAGTVRACRQSIRRYDMEIELDEMLYRARFDGKAVEHDYMR